eukprot:830468-Rhodomonas_salina.2
MIAIPIIVGRQGRTIGGMQCTRRQSAGSSRLYHDNAAWCPQTLSVPDSPYHTHRPIRETYQAGAPSPCPLGTACLGSWNRHSRLEDRTIRRTAATLLHQYHLYSQ